MSTAASPTAPLALSRTCTRCKFTTDAPALHFHRDNRSKSGYTSQCKVCQEAVRKARRSRDLEEIRRRDRENKRRRMSDPAIWERELAAAKARYQKNPHKERQQARLYYAAHTEEKRQKMREHYQRNRHERIAQVRLYYRLTRAIEDGKASPVCRRVGFVIARFGRGALASEWRAARLDRPLQPAEVALCRYEHIGGKWVISEPPIVTPHAPAITAWCQRYEAKSAALSSGRR